MQVQVLNQTLDWYIRRLPSNVSVTIIDLLKNIRTAIDVGDITIAILLLGTLYQIISGSKHRHILDGVNFPGPYPKFKKMYSALSSVPTITLDGSDYESKIVLRNLRTNTLYEYDWEKRKLGEPLRQDCPEKKQYRTLVLNQDKDLYNYPIKRPPGLYGETSLYQKL